MILKVTPSTVNKLADRIAGAVVDLAYTKKEDSWTVCDVLLDKRFCFVSLETEVEIMDHEIERIVRTLSENSSLPLHITRRSPCFSSEEVSTKCIGMRSFCAAPLSPEQSSLAGLAEMVFYRNGSAGRYVNRDSKIFAYMKSDNSFADDLYARLEGKVNFVLLELKDSAGASNRELASDLGSCYLGGGVCGKCTAHPDVAVAIYAFLKASAEHRPVAVHCSFMDDEVDGRPYQEIVAMAKSYIVEVGGFERLAEWGLIR